MKSTYFTEKGNHTHTYTNLYFPAKLNLLEKPVITEQQQQQKKPKYNKQQKCTCTIWSLFISISNSQLQRVEIKNKSL